ncbi:ester cyclase [Maribius pontilimi]|uniref:Ester cyclase n=1 Tax=Palleronia pontilimi TaxID=1964209 RepID=A0A934IJ66_9RHOB|nr:ester cyclase [Palleronia pontilimi]MBJ3763992.1 ester cyclase [Palleronia pontilimi]
MGYSDLLKDFYATIWVRGETDRIGDFFLADSEADGLFPDMAIRPEDFQAMVLAMSRLVEDIHVEILKTVEQDDWLSALVRAKCRARDTGEPLTLTGQAMLRFRDGKIAEAHNQFDLFGFFTQLGHLPEDALLRILSDETLD